MSTREPDVLIPEGDASGAAVSAPSDFISAYAGCADVLEAPRILHEIMAIQLVAAAFNCNGVKIPWGGITLSLDL